MNRSFKLVGRHPFTKRQLKKRVYTSSSDYMKYKDELINRYRSYCNVEVYELISGKWSVIFTANYLPDPSYIRNGYKY